MLTPHHAITSYPPTAGATRTHPYEDYNCTRAMVISHYSSHLKIDRTKAQTRKSPGHPQMRHGMRDALRPHGRDPGLQGLADPGVAIDRKLMLMACGAPQDKLVGVPPGSGCDAPVSRHEARELQGGCCRVGASEWLHRWLCLLLSFASLPSPLPSSHPIVIPALAASETGSPAAKGFFLVFVILHRKQGTQKEAMTESLQPRTRRMTAQ